MTGTKVNAPPRVVLVPCRAATVVGNVALAPLVGPAPSASAALAVTQNAEIPMDAWIDVSPSSHVTARNPRSTREITLAGPGRARPCLGEDEEAWLLRGGFESVAGSGERPGGEQWLVTPFGVVAYSAAKTAVDVTESGATVRVGQGAPLVWASEGVIVTVVGDAGPGTAADAGAPEPWTRVDVGRMLTLRLDKKGTPDELAGSAVDVCGRLAQDARSLAVRIAAPDASLGELTPQHVRARRLARAGCGVARVRVEALAPSVARDALLDRARLADAEWRTLGPL